MAFQKCPVLLSEYVSRYCRYTSAGRYFLKYLFIFPQETEYPVKMPTYQSSICYSILRTSIL